MYLFNRVEKKEINGLHEVFAINDQTDQAYLLRDVIINTSTSSLDGFSLSITCRNEKYIYTGNFKTESEMKTLADHIVSLMSKANIENNAR